MVFNQHCPFLMFIISRGTWSPGRARTPGTARTPRRARTTGRARFVAKEIFHHAYFLGYKDLVKSQLVVYHQFCVLIGWATSRLYVIAHYSRREFWESVSQKSQNFSGLFQLPQFPLYLRNAKVLSHQIMESSWYFLHKKHVQRPAFQNEWIAVWQLAFWAGKVLATFKNQAPGAKLFVMLFCRCGRTLRPQGRSGSTRRAGNIWTIRTPWGNSYTIRIIKPP